MLKIHQMREKVVLQTPEEDIYAFATNLGLDLRLKSSWNIVYKASRRLSPFELRECSQPEVDILWQEKGRAGILVECPECGFVWMEFTGKDHPPPGKYKPLGYLSQIWGAEEWSSSPSKGLNPFHSPTI